MVGLAVRFAGRPARCAGRGARPADTGVSSRRCAVDTEPAIVTAKTPVAARPPMATGVNELADQAQHHLAQGDRDEALSLLARAASIAPGDPRLRRVVDDALTSARAAAAQARAAASASGAAGGAGYRDTDSRGLEAARLERAGSRVRALALWWQAADGYAVAMRDTRAAVPVPAAEAVPVPAPAGPSADERHGPHCAAGLCGRVCGARCRGRPARVSVGERSRRCGDRSPAAARNRWRSGMSRWRSPAMPPRCRARGHVGRRHRTARRRGRQRFTSRGLQSGPAATAAG